MLTAITFLGLVFLGAWLVNVENKLSDQKALTHRMGQKLDALQGHLDLMEARLRQAGALPAHSAERGAAPSGAGVTEAGAKKTDPVASKVDDEKARRAAAAAAASAAAAATAATAAAKKKTETPAKPVVAPGKPAVAPSKPVAAPRKAVEQPPTKPDTVKKSDTPKKADLPAAAGTAAMPARAKPAAAAASASATAGTKGARDASKPPKPPKPPVSGDKKTAAKRRDDKPKRGLEELLGMQLYIWLGAIALALSGTLLVKYTVDQGLLGPPVRVTLGVMLGSALLVAGEVLRRTSRRAGSGLTAGGVAVLMASFYAASTVFELINPWAGFVLMGLSAGLGVALSMRQGPIVAAVGLLGGFLTPYLVRSGLDPSPAPLFLYLLLLQLGVLAVSRRRGWWALSALSMVGGAVWLLMWLSGPFEAHDGPWLYVYLLAATAALVVSVRRGSSADKPTGMPPMMGMWTSAAAMLLAGLVIVAAGFGTQDWLFIGLLGSATILLGALDRRYELLPWMAAGISAALLAGWAVSLRIDWLPLQWMTRAGLEIDSSPARVVAETASEFLPIAVALALLYALGAFLVLWWRPQRAHLWAGLSAVAVLGGYLVAGLGHELVSWAYSDAVRSVGGATGSAPIDVPWGEVGLALAGLTVVAAGLLQMRRSRWSDGAATVTPHAAAAAVIGAIGVYLAFEGFRIPMLWALELMLVVMAARSYQLPKLRLFGWPLFVLIGLPLVTMAGVLLDPLGDRTLLTWLPLGYGVPLVGFAVASYVSHRDGDRLMSLALRWGALAVGLVGLSVGIRQAFNPGNLSDPAVSLVESATYVSAWLIVAICLIAAGRRWPVDVLVVGGQGVALLGVAAGFLGPVLTTNPLFTGDPVGPYRVVNWLIYAYGLPAALAFVASYLVRRRGDKEIALLLSMCGTGFLAVFIGLQVRQWFHPGDDLSRSAMTLVESASYGLAWLVVGLGLYEIARRWKAHDAPLAGNLLAVLGIAAYVVGPVLVSNPLLTGDPVGSYRVINWLLYAYGLPALLAFAAARLAYKFSEEPRGLALDVCATGFMLVLLGLQVRQWFHVGQDLGRGGMGFVESATYGAIWMLAGVLLVEAERRLRLRGLSISGMALAAIGLSVSVLLPVVITNPLFTGADVGSVRIANWLIYGYGLPAVLAFVVYYQQRSGGDRYLRRYAAAVGSGLVFVFVTMQIRHWFHPGDHLGRGDIGLVEFATYGIVWMAAGLAFLMADRRWQRRELAYGGKSLLALGLAATIAGPLLLVNPLFTGERVGGWPVLNWLTYAYGLPAMLAVLAGRELKRRGEDAAAGVLMTSGIALGFVLINMLVRQFFHGAEISGYQVEVAENYAYSLVWVLYGVVLLVAGIRGGGRLVRFASLAVMMLAVAKVFLYDAASLEDLYRVLSFLGLGLSLIGLALLYQKFVFRTEAD